MGTLVRFFALFAMISIAACTTTPSGSFCDIASPMRPSAAAVDAMTDEQVAAMLAHNNRGERLCSWRP